MKVTSEEQDEGLYRFDKVSGTLTHHPRNRRSRVKAIAAVGFLLFIAISAFVIMKELEEAKAADISNFRISREGDYLKVSFSLINAKKEVVAADGTAQLSFYNSNGSLIYKEEFAFSNKDFSKSSGWQYTHMISLETLNGLIPKDESLAKIMINKRTLILGARVLLKVIRNDGKTLPFILYPIAMSEVEAEKIVMRLYYRNEIRNLQTEIDKQWPSYWDWVIEDYIRLGNYGWAVVRRVERKGVIIIPNPLWGICDWYIIHAEDGGYGWTISWRGNSRPLFKIEFLSENGVKVTTPNAIFYTEDGGETWQVKK